MIDVESAGRALEAYTGKQLTGMNDEEQQEALQDVLTDLEHLTSALGLHWPEYEAHLHYLQEAKRCFGCGMTRDEIQTEYEADLKFTGKGDPRVIPPEECAGHWDRLGEAGPHMWEEVAARTRVPLNIGEDSDS